MLLSSMVFLWPFLPSVLVINLVLLIRLGNLSLLAVSFIFYVWGRQKYIRPLLLLLAVNYAGAMGMEAVQGNGHDAGTTGTDVGADGAAAVSDRQTTSGTSKQTLITPDKLLLVMPAAVNLGFLGCFKYFDFLTGLVNRLAGGAVMEPENLLLSVGISSYTPQMVSYGMGVYRRIIRVEGNLLSLGLYMSLFPKVMQGLVGCYQGMGACTRNCHVTPELLTCGARRFTCELGKKVILANQSESVVDKVLANSVGQIGGDLGWYMGILYAPQIYPDFSGYSDTAVGLGKMLGFKPTENFNHPYLVRTVGEFWRRQHTSLPGWFKDYPYIPLGGSRRGILITCRNLMIVFLCTRFWYGASLSFTTWGMYYGRFQVAERLFLRRRLDRLPAVVSYIYMFSITVVGWTMLRADSLTRGLMLLGQVSLLRPGIYDTVMYMSHKTTVYMVIGTMLCGPFQALVPCFRRHMQDDRNIYLSEDLGPILLFAYSIVITVGNIYNPFIYFRFQRGGCR